MHSFINSFVRPYTVGPVRDQVGNPALIQRLFLRRSIPRGSRIKGLASGRPWSAHRGAGVYSYHIARAWQQAERTSSNLAHTTFTVAGF